MANFIPFHEVGSSKVVTALLNMQRQCVLLKKMAESYVDWRNHEDYKQDIARYEYEPNRQDLIETRKKGYLKVMAKNVLSRVDVIKKQFEIIKASENS